MLSALEQQQELSTEMARGDLESGMLAKLNRKRTSFIVVRAASMPAVPLATPCGAVSHTPAAATAVAQLNQAHSTATGPPDPGCQSVCSPSACVPSLSRVHHHTGQPIARRHRQLRVLTVAPHRFCAQLPTVLTLQTASPS
eukprot:COSAG06_NODE_6623_length_2852_cov_4.446785_4_plen_141_part_00